MKKVGMFVAVFVVGLSSIVLGLTYPQHSGFVNDFANIFSSQDEQKMETFLQNYEKKTSVEIAVVTTSSLNNLSIEEWTLGLATQWGVGKKSKDNGIVIAIAPKARKYRIEVGYGLEWIITDSVAGKFGRDLLVPAFKKGDYAGGVNALLQAITRKIGQGSAAERDTLQKAHKQKEAQIAQARKEQEKKIFVGGILTGIVGLVMFLFYIMTKFVRDFFVELKRKKLLRNEIKTTLVQLTEKVNEHGDKLSQVYSAKANLPSWARDKVESILGITEREMTNFQKTSIDVNALTTEDPDGAFNQLNQRVIPTVDKIGFKLEEADDVFKELDYYHKHSSELVGEIDNKITQLSDSASEAIEKGFIFDALDTTEFVESLADIRMQLVNNTRGAEDDILNIHRQLERLSERVLSGQAQVDDKVESKRRIDETASYLLEKVQELEGLIPRYKEKLEMLMSNNHKNVWDELQQRFDYNVEKIAKVEHVVAESKKIGSMENQQFHKALDVLDLASSIIHDLGNVYEDMDCLLNAIEEAKGDNSRLFERATDVVQKAQRVAKDSDVSSVTKRAIASVSSQLKYVESTLEADNPDWIAINNSLKEIINKAKKLIKKANNEIEEERRRRRRRNSSSSIGGYVAESFSSSSETSSDNNSFGGGSFGGGGASGSW